MHCHSQRTLTMFVGVVALRHQHHTTCYFAINTTIAMVLITRCHNSTQQSVFSQGIIDIGYLLMLLCNSFHSYSVCNTLVVRLCFLLLALQTTPKKISNWFGERSCLTRETLRWIIWTFLILLLMYMMQVL